MTFHNPFFLYKHFRVNSPNKNSLSLMRSNLICPTIFLTSEKYRMTNQKPDFSQGRKFVSVFSTCRGGHAKQLTVNVCNVPCFPRIIASRFADINSVKEFIEDQENENTRKKTQQNVALLKEFLTLRNDSRFIEEIRKPKRKPKFL